jgi:O-antigen/teichoic acid export membrane protein
VTAVVAFRFVDPVVGSYLAVLFPIAILFAITTNAVAERVVSQSTAPVGAAVVAGLITFAALGVASLAWSLGPRAFVASYVIGKIVEAAVIAGGRWWVLAVHWGEMRAVAAELWPFSAHGILAVLYSRSAIFVVEQTSTRQELGVFSVAAAVQNALLLIPVSMALTRFPALTRLAKTGDVRAIRDIVARYVKSSALAVAGCVIVLWMTIYAGAPILGFSVHYAPLVAAVGTLAFLGILSMMAGFLLQAYGEEARAVRLSLATLVASVVFQFTALTLFGLWGVVLAIAAAEIFTIALFWYAIRDVELRLTRP